MSTSNEGRCCDAVMRVIERREENNRRILSVDSKDSPGVEVRCDIGGRIFALEHTTLDPYPNKRADDNRFLAVLEPLKKTVDQTGLIPSDRRLNLLVDAHAFLRFKKSEFARIGAELQDWVLQNHGKMSPPRAGRAAVLSAGPPNLPVKALLQCFSERGQLKGKISIGRLAPENLEELRHQRISETIARRGPKLHAEHVAGSTAVLILENFEHSVSNHIVIAECVHSALDETDYIVDEVYLVETGAGGEFTVLQLRCGDSRWPTQYDNPPMWAFEQSELNELVSQKVR